MANDKKNPNAEFEEMKSKAISQPLVDHIYTADPSAHVFDDKIYIYPSHDIDAGIPEDDLGSHFGMRDYHVLSMDDVNSKAVDNGIALDLKDVPWASGMLWAPDAAYKNGTYYFYFPAKDKDGIFRIGVATGKSPVGPFKAQPEAIKGSFSIDPAVFVDDNGRVYMYFGGLWGGQLQRWRTGKFRADGPGPTDHVPTGNEPALCPKVARMNEDMLEFAEPAKDLVIVDEKGKPIIASDNNRRFFEAAWMHKYNGTYYFSYSTGDTHFICYATSNNPYGPFTYRGIVLNPVIGWTNHHSIAEFRGKWYLFYHDSTLSGGITHLRCVKMTELKHRSDGTIETITAYKS